MSVFKVQLISLDRFYNTGESQIIESYLIYLYEVIYSKEAV